jgi:hypothetical protein
MMEKNSKGKQLLLLGEQIYSDEDIYSEGIAEDFSDNDEISSAEEGFMAGYLAA